MKNFTLRHCIFQNSGMTNKFFSVVAVAFITMSLFSACDKKSSSDTPLTPTYNASVYIGGDNHIVYAIDPMTGLKNWEFSTSAKIYASPLIYNEMVYAGADGATYGDTLYKLNAQTGKVVKSFYQNLNPFHIVATPVADGGLIYLACTNNTLYALDTASLSIQWQYNTGGPLTSAPVVHAGYVFFGSADGFIYSVDKTSGTFNWSWNPVVAGVSTTTESWSSSPAIGIDSNTGNDIVTALCIGGTNKMYCLQLNDATHSLVSCRWTYPTGGAVTSSPTIYGGACIFGCADFNVYCVDIYNGSFLRWKYTTGSSVTSSPYAYKNVIYVGSNDYNLYALNFSSGTLKWYFSTAGMVHSSPVVWGPYVYVGSYDKSFYAIDTALGQKKWSFVINNNIESSPAVDNNTGGFGTNSSISGMTN
jgi:eukaryotic-like serine/threonine-protein kinase